MSKVKSVNSWCFQGFQIFKDLAKCCLNLKANAKLNPQKYCLELFWPTTDIFKYNPQAIIFFNLPEPFYSTIIFLTFLNLSPRLDFTF
jgi:hypothetical protein